MLEHSRYNEWLLFVVEDGSFEFECNGTKGIAANGDLVLLPCGTDIYRKALTPLSFHFFIFDWTNSDEEVKEVSSRIPRGKFQIQDASRFQSTLAQLRSVSEKPDSLSVARRNLLFKDIWLTYWSGESEMMPSSSDPLMNESLRRIRQQALGRFNLKTIADELWLSPSQFTQKFTKQFGKTPMDYVTELRLQQARKLLKDTSLPMSAIAARCGYENEYYFSRIFKQKMAVSPSNYRKALRI
ncbi:AraC family transcriptional regulator [Paenibacillus lignilyticus]|uniref:Helix-turn-helix transcriptional regulator n=1 Tax=Paenibacillus lignilyticus TaxID=1172615 RepID=A0ABS5CAI6_9BACL|nr:AraC family transcriptional regulator [Paenibacillus lignilyticus]MBP3963001.1 helix-turn-helix transcriptional regulator [Paenibacillus lignilyticus]